VKRSGPLKRGKPLQRRTPLKRGGPLRRKRKHVPLALARLAREFTEAWHEATGTVCEVCGATASAEVRIEGHHIVRQQLIRGASAAAKWSGEVRARMLWDLRNKLDLCERCHGRHHRRLPTLKWSLIERLRPEAVEFAEQVDLLWRAKMDYDLEGDR
jgi:hypothetical protein